MTSRFSLLQHPVTVGNIRILNMFIRLTRMLSKGKKCMCVAHLSYKVVKNA